MITMNMQKLMQQAQQMQRDITKKQEKINSELFEGNSEWITITINGKKEVKKVVIKYDGNIDEDREMLEDMLAIALNDAIKKVNEKTESELGQYSSMLNGLM